jgi:hypothetical protein
VDEELPKGWKECIHPQGWIYFYSPELQIVTDQDMRIPHIRDLILGHPLGPVPAEMEVHLNVQTRLDMPALASESVTHISPSQGRLSTVLSLVVNHNECVASYDSAEVTPEKILAMDANTRRSAIMRVISLKL